jgi:hypothetical protein
VEFAERELDGGEALAQTFEVILSPLVAQDLNADLAASGRGNEEEAFAGLKCPSENILNPLNRL